MCSRQNITPQMKTWHQKEGPWRDELVKIGHWRREIQVPAFAAVIGCWLALLFSVVKQDH